MELIVFIVSRRVFKVLSTCIYMYVHVYIKSVMYNMFLLFTLILTEDFLYHQRISLQLSI